MEMTIDKIQLLLKEHSLRVTKTRLAMAEILLDYNDQYLSSEEIFHILNETSIGCDQVSVYRILTKYEELGIVKKSEFHHEAARYRIQDSSISKHNHEHYFKCTNCLNIESFHDCFISKKEKELSAKGYKNLSHHLEITGLCPSCA